MDSDAKDKVGTALDVAAAVGGAAVAGASTPAIVATGGVVGVAGVLKLAVGAISRRNERRSLKWWNALVKNSRGRSPVEVEEAIAARMDEPAVHETVAQSVRTMLEAVDEAVVPILGSLAAEYLGDGRKPDWFFRGLARVLCDLDEDELTGLRGLVAALSEEPAEPERLMSLKIIGRRGRLDVGLLRTPGNPDPEKAYAWLGAVPHAMRIFYLLKINGLARDVPTGGFGESGGPYGLVISSDVVHRLGLHIVDDRME